MMFIIPVEPKGQKRARAGKGFVYKDPVQKSREDDLMVYLLKEAPPEPLKGPMYVEITAYFKRPGTHYGKKDKKPYLKGVAPAMHTNTPDADNVAKMLLDCMNKVFFKDDSQVSVLVIRKMYSEKPRWEITIFEIVEDYLE